MLLSNDQAYQDTEQEAEDDELPKPDIDREFCHEFTQNRQQSML
jgi:hypothetical protein